MTGLGQIKKGEMSEQGKVRLSCESADTNWEIEWPQQKFWKGASAGRR